MKKTLILSVSLLFTALTAGAQSLTGYFVRNSTFNHEFNAAFAPDQGYVGFPFLSGVNLQVGSNLTPSKLMYPLSDGSTGLFLNHEVSADQFLSGIRKNNYLGTNINYKLIDAGWYTWKDSFWTLSFGVKADVDLSIPGEFMRFAKVGMNQDPTNYCIENLGLTGQVYGQMALGYSQGLDKWVKGLRVGGKFKFLVSMMDVQASIDRMDLSLGSQSWTARTSASASVYGGGLAFRYGDDGYVDGLAFDPSALGVGGYGAAFDLGVEYTISEGTPVDGMRFSLSVTDLGFITYAADKSTRLSSSGEVVYEGFDGLGKDTDFNSILTTLKDDAFSMISFAPEQSGKSRSRMMTAKLYAGVDYSFLQDKMNVGLLYTARFGKLRTENELTLAWNYAPVRSFDIALSYSLLKTHSTIGWLITFVPKRGIGLFVGSDFTPLNYTAVNIMDALKIPVPKNELMLDVHFGLTISMGGTNARH
ncbi:MAG TPA: hypothetical protein IAC04_05065 [Candidatus Coprenecus stercoravium]|uniref:DUF5723 domain-containing protein n=1 Tax=Candidatus Coprenecus stercoravium TaxID=2840735 RepID=A0A9D2GRE1_9BACT|nr:hypothetical protein [Candidatus Coprenecus stercoravium]